MSRTYSIACNDCKKSLWIAQWGTLTRIYYGDEAVMDALRDFLFEHIGHRLEFNDCETFLNRGDYVRIGKGWLEE